MTGRNLVSRFGLLLFLLLFIAGAQLAIWLNAQTIVQTLVP